MPKRYSTVRGREFGEGVREAIARTGMNGQQFAGVMGWQEAKVSDMKTGKGGVTLTEVAMALSACRVPATERDRLLELFPAIDLEGWWQQHGYCAPIRSRTAHDHVAAAKTLISWHSHAIPLLLQTPEYARAMLRASATIPEEELDERLQALQEMQLSLSNDLRCTFYIHELALDLQLGEPEEHLSQLHRLKHMATWSKITVRVVPKAARAHPGMAGPFTLLNFHEPAYLPMVWTETENSSLFVEATQAVTGYESVVRQLHAVSLEESESVDLIVRLLQDGDGGLPASGS
ncbi:helix-turn-helix domain-containing protein [Lentzea cavernae]|uniref:Transcriptional regulator n=1 Tax=Lentzea cavernae TaxID=2020703 RepID=A0ABQ3MWC8_9PSEU|nr:helix-turn-helix transcriptional regulator [Lentzea cavernae]GHH62516.1 transcriptional regulator [Lentzea cavernae]